MMSTPSNTTRPVAGTTPCNARRREVLPAPLAPSTVTISPAATVKLTAETAGLRP